jgi:Uma2 family endonuclease
MTLAPTQKLFTTADYFDFCQKLQEFESAFEFSEGFIYDKHAGKPIATEIIEAVLAAQQTEINALLTSSLTFSLTMASKKHKIILSNLNMHLATFALPNGFRIHIDGCELYLAVFKKYRKPDAMVTNKEKEQYNQDDQLLNPLVIVEILSPSTAEIDQNDKLREYMSIESLQEYVLIWQDQPLIKHYTKETKNQEKAVFVQQYEQMQETLWFESLKVGVEVGKIYEGV